MKTCTLIKKNEDGTFRVVGFSIVHDDHEFGWTTEWNEEVLHYEGSVQIVPSKEKP